MADQAASPSCATRSLLGLLLGASLLALSKPSPFLYFQFWRRAEAFRASGALAALAWAVGQERMT